MPEIRILPVLVTFLVLLGGGAAVPLRAQVIPSPYRFLDHRQEAGVFVGHLDSSRGTFSLGPAGGIYYGVRYGIDVSGPFGLEGVLAFFPTTRDVIDPRRPEGDRSRGEADVAMVQVDARLRFSLLGQRTWHDLSPFLLFGGGLGFDVASRPDLDEQLRESDRFRFGWKVRGVFGGGTRWMVSERVLVRADAYLDLWQIDTPSGFQDVSLGLDLPPPSQWLNNPAFTVGLAYRF